MMSYAVILLVLGVILALLEIFIPSGGILGVLSAGAIIGSVVLAFRESDGTGFVFLALTLVLVPSMIVLGLKIFPKTPVGRRVILKPAVEKSQDRGIAGVSDENYQHIVGKSGRTITPLRPSGVAEIEGERYSVVAEGEMIDNNVIIEVIRTDGNSIVVDQKEA